MSDPHVRVNTRESEYERASLAGKEKLLTGKESHSHIRESEEGEYDRESI